MTEQATKTEFQVFQTEPRRITSGFESTGSEPLVLLRFGVKAQNAKDGRIDYTPP